MDDDILTFLSHLVHTIQQVDPSFGTELSVVLDNMNRYIRDEELNILCSLFINDILTCKTEITMILDDFHQIEHSYTINTWMERLLAHIPANLHIVISSRSRPGWSHLTKMKVCGQLLEITREDLVLTMDEMELLLTDLYGLEMDQKDLQSIYDITEGGLLPSA